jgi:hypothetical protein
VALKITINSSGRLQDSASAVNSVINSDGTSTTELIAFQTMIKSSYLPLSSSKNVAGNAVPTTGATVRTSPNRVFNPGEERAVVLKLELKVYPNFRLMKFAIGS